MKKTPSLFLVGGFLGAGKTTAIRALAGILAERGLKVAAITNDQAAGLVDTYFLAGQGVPSEEVTGSCFCCNFEGLSKAIQNSIDKAHPDVILAEPVGSCIDIVATIIRPMRSLMQSVVDVRGYSVLMEPKRWLECEKNEGNAAWSIKFLFDKQVQEADFLVINKSDTLSSQELEIFKSDIQLRYPESRVLTISAKESSGIGHWLDLIQTSVSGDKWLKELDYQKYAEAEAEMGWLNAQLAIKFLSPQDGKTIVASIGKNILEELETRKGRIGHVKFLAVGNTGSIKVGATVSGQPMDLEGVFNAPLLELQLTLNVRAAVSPGNLAETALTAVNFLRESFYANVDLEYMNTFRPGAPNPTYRYSN